MMIFGAKIQISIISIQRDFLTNFLSSVNLKKKLQDLEFMADF